MSTKSDFEIMSEMSKTNKDIRLSTNLVNLQKVKAGGYVTIGVDHGTINTLMGSAVGSETTHIVALYVIDKKQFFELKNSSDEQKG